MAAETSEKKSFAFTLKEGNKKVNPIATIAIILSFPLLVIGFLSITAIVLITSFDGTLNLTNIFQAQDYIEPGDENAAELLEDSYDNFEFTYSEDVDISEYDYEKYFILINTQIEYQRLSKLFDKEIPYLITINLTNDQETYEEDFGTDLDYDLEYAAFTRYGFVEVYIGEDKLYPKQSLKNMLGHELVHVFQQDTFNYQFARPIWFEEGTAEYFSNAPLLPLDYYYDEIGVSELNGLSQQFNEDTHDEVLHAYLVSYNFVNYLKTLRGEDKLIELSSEELEKPFEVVFYDLYGQTPDEAYTAWLQAY